MGIVKYKKFKILILLIFLIFTFLKLHSQNVNIYPDISVEKVPEIFSPGIFLVPKTDSGASDFLNNQVHYSSIRLIAIETALNYYGVKSINDVMLILESMQQSILYVNNRCDKLFIPIMKMPYWLSATSDTSSLENESDKSWKKYHAFPPASYLTWKILLDSIVNKFNNQWGLNPYYEIWNEPDNFYWQDTPESYFNFFKNSYFGIRQNHPKALIGGPSVSSFNSCFRKSLPGGYLSDELLEQTILAQLIDSCVAWNAPLDFLSWHKFDPFTNSFEFETSFLNRKFIKSGHNKVPFMITEWNQTYTLRDTPFAAALMTNNLINMNKAGISAQIVAAWQDFDSSLTEFHKDYGLISYGALHKPIWKSLLLLNKINGNLIKTDYAESGNLSIVSSKKDDTIRILVSNYLLTPYYETLLNLLLKNKFNTNNLISSGYSRDTQLDSIFRGLINVELKDSLSLALINSVPIYKTFDSLFKNGRNLFINISSFTGFHKCKVYLIDSNNNNIFKSYDKLIKSGKTRNESIIELYKENELISNELLFNDSTLSINLQSNGIALIEINNSYLSVNETFLSNRNIFIYPYPASDFIEISYFPLEKGARGLSEEVRIYNVFGEEIYLTPSQNNLTPNPSPQRRGELRFDISSFVPGVYFVRIGEKVGKFVKF